MEGIPTSSVSFLFCGKNCNKLSSDLCTLISFNAFPSSASHFVGLFLRHMILAYSKLSFSQVFKLYTALQQYFQNGEKKAAEDTDMELTREEGERKMEKEELDLSVR